jgi:hypothetical protein
MMTKTLAEVYPTMATGKTIETNYAGSLRSPVLLMLLQISLLIFVACEHLFEVG